jgi:hypothetical protein
MMAALFRRRIVEAGCRFDHSLKLCEDWDFWLQALAHTDFVHVDKISARYRISGASSEIWTNKALADDATRRVFAKWRRALTEDKMFQILSRAGRASKAEGEARKLQSAYKDRSRHLEHLEKAYREREAESEALRSAYEARTEQVERLDEGYKARGAQIDHLTKAYASQGQQIADLQAENLRMQEYVRQLESTFWHRFNKRLGLAPQKRAD